MTNRIEHTTEANVSVLVMIKGEQRYVFVYTADNRHLAEAQMGKFAADPELDFSWQDVGRCLLAILEAS